MNARAELPPGPSLPAVLQTLSFLRDPLALFERCHRQFGDLFTLEIGPRSMVMACEPSLVKAIYRADPDTLAAGAAKRTVFGPIVGDASILVLDGEEHIRRRRLLLPAFRGERMLAYTDLMRRAAEELLPEWPRDRAFSLHERVAHIAALAAIRGIFGEDLDPRLPAALTRVVTEGLGSKLLFIPPLQRDLGPRSPWGKIVRMLAEADELLIAEIERRRADADPGRVDTLSLLLAARGEDGEALSTKQLRDELITLVAAGYEISGLSLAWVITDIISRPQVHARLRDEVARVTGGAPLRSEQVGELVLIEAAIRESMRLHPAVAQGSVRVVQRPFELGPYCLPPGAFVSVNMHLLHRRHDCYDQPLDFQLDRFVGRAPPHFAWVPFGGGTRRCLGMQLAMHEFKVVICTLLQRTDLRLDQAEVLPERRGAFMGPSGGPLVRASMRSEP